MLNHTRPQLHLAAHRGLGASALTHHFSAEVIRRRMFAATPTAAAGKDGRRLSSAPPSLEGVR
jgi:hypothetical protein